MPVRGRRSCTRVGEWACGSRAIGEWGGRAGTRVPARRRVGCPTRGEWAVPLAASGRVTRRRVGEWGGREGRGVLLGASRTARVDFVFSDVAACGAEAPQLLGTAAWSSLDRAAWSGDVIAGGSAQGVVSDETTCPWRHRHTTANLRDVCVMIGMGQHQMLLRFMRRGNSAEATTLWKRYKSAGSGVVCEDAALPWRT